MPLPYLSLNKLILFENRDANMLAGDFTVEPAPSVFHCREGGPTLCPVSQKPILTLFLIVSCWLSLEKPCGYVAPTVFTKNALFSVKDHRKHYFKNTVLSDLCWAFTETGSGSFVSWPEYISNHICTAIYCPQKALQFPPSLFSLDHIQLKTGQCGFAFLLETWERWRNGGAFFINDKC